MFLNAFINKIYQSVQQKTSYPAVDFSTDEN